MYTYNLYNYLNSSETKYESGTGWPSFYKCAENSCREIVDSSHGMVRTEVVCSKVIFIINRNLHF